jgi:hypothetical protein
LAAYKNTLAIVASTTSTTPLTRRQTVIPILQPGILVKSLRSTVGKESNHANVSWDTSSPPPMAVHNAVRYATRITINNKIL